MTGAVGRSDSPSAVASSSRRSVANATECDLRALLPVVVTIVAEEGIDIVCSVSPKLTGSAAGVLMLTD
jgi:hypothetical protein